MNSHSWANLLKVKFLGPLKSLIGDETVELTKNEVRLEDLMGAINEVAPLPEKEFLDPSGIIFIVNGSALEMQENKLQLLKDGDEIILLPVAHGG